MNNKGLVSAIITTHNRCDLLKRAINSVLNQTYNHIELIVVDDASTDRTEIVCHNKNLKYIKIDKKDSKGGNFARNMGIREASGEFIAFCDDDDYWLPEKIEHQVQLFKNPELGFVYCGRKLEIINANKVELKTSIPESSYKGDVSRLVFKDIFCLTSTLMVRKALLEQVGLFDENIRAWQEHELVIRLSQVSKTDAINLPLTVYRVDTNDKNRITNKFFQWKNSVEYIKKKHRNLILNLSFKERFQFYSLIASDGIGRAKVTNNKFQWLKYRFLVHWYNFLIKDIVYL